MPQVRFDKDPQILPFAQLLHEELCEAVAEAGREVLLAHIRRGVHAGKETRVAC